MPEETDLRLKSEFVGVSWHTRGQKWSCKITFKAEDHSQKVCLGLFDDDQEAARAYDTAARQLRLKGEAHGGRSGSGTWLYLNFPTDAEAAYAAQQGMPLDMKERKKRSFRTPLVSAHGPAEAQPGAPVPAAAATAGGDDASESESESESGSGELGEVESAAAPVPAAAAAAAPDLLYGVDDESETESESESQKAAVEAARDAECEKAAHSVGFWVSAAASAGADSGQEPAAKRTKAEPEVIDLLGSSSESESERDDAGEVEEYEVEEQVDRGRTANVEATDVEALD